MKIYRKGFTLSELLIALGVISILCAVLLPIIFNLMPNQNVVMARRAFNVAQVAVSDLINDENCYPDLTRSSTNPKVGFDDGSGYAKCQAWGVLKSGSSHDKFAVLFANKLGITSVTASEQSFKTQEGMEWTIYGGTDDCSECNVIEIDVNGASNGTNCSTQYELAGSLWEDEETGELTVSPSATLCSADWDIFQIKVKPNGKMEIGEAWARNAIKVDKDFIGPASNQNLDNEDDFQDVDWHERNPLG